MRAALYARVSTDGQDTANQLEELRQWAATARYTVAGEYVDNGVSGTKGEDDRPQLKRMLADAHKRKFDLVAIWALDRLTRRGLDTTLQYLRRLDAAGVILHSHTEPLLSTSDPIVRSILLALMSSLAASEREKISARTKAGLMRVKAKGIKLGRRPIPEHLQDRIAELVAEGLTSYRIGKLVGLDPHTVRKYAAAE